MRACVTIDLDSLYCYQQIYDLPIDKEDNCIYEIGLERFVNLMESLGLRGTLFAVANDLEMGDNRRILKYLSSRGFEIANHSLSHPYQLTKLPADERRRELAESRGLLEQATGSSVIGFRAPGYNMTTELMAQIFETGHRYDSSVFPCTPYYLTKIGALATMATLGKQSHSVAGDPTVLFAPRNPYKPNKKFYWRKGGEGLWEFPISTSPVLRLPLLGSFIVLSGKKWFPAVQRMLELGNPTLVLEFHGMDFMDGIADGLPTELLRQPDIAVDWNRKEELFYDVLHKLKARCDVVPICEAMESLELETNNA